MTNEDMSKLSIGWIGAGRMGYPMAYLLLQAGCDVTVWNRTRSKAEPLMEYGAKVVDSPAELAGCDVIFTMVGGPDDLIQVISGPQGVLSNTESTPRIFIDCTSVNDEASDAVRVAIAARGAAFLAAPVSGNGKVVKARRLTIVASGPKDVFDEVEPLLKAIAPNGAVHVGDADMARTMKICHNVFLGVVTQSLAEICVLAEKYGVKRSDFMEFMNQSVMGSTFSKYKTPSFVNLDLTPTFTPLLLKKDMDLGLSLARELGVPMPVAAVTREMVQSAVGRGHTDCDFAILLHLEAENAGLKLEPENIEVSDGLTPPAK
ncbi:MAG: NAD(P)-dependent oxidoreductase [Rhodospirillales bacterium]|nr:NAD(P)-dependent oxidoreductase [Rhodospirillales bacterium]